MNYKKTTTLLILVVLTSTALSALTVEAKIPDEWKGVGRSGSELFIYVKSQDLYFDSIVAADPLPFNEGNAHTFQKLYGAGYGAPHWTEYGPGDPEYTGGRWWLDLNGNDLMDPEGIDHYFSCPLLGPGYTLE